MLYEGRRESLIAKKLQESRDFCFWNGWIAATEQISRKTGDGADLSNDAWGGHRRQQKQSRSWERRRGCDGGRANPVRKG